MGDRKRSACTAMFSLVVRTSRIVFLCNISPQCPGNVTQKCYLGLTKKIDCSKIIFYGHFFLQTWDADSLIRSRYYRLFTAFYFVVFLFDR